MTEILLCIAITSLASLGFHFASRDGMILGGVERFWNYYINRGMLHRKYRNRADVAEYISKPFSECPTCMGSVWGVAGAFIFLGTDWRTVVVCLGVAGLNHILNNILP